MGKSSEVAVSCLAIGFQTLVFELLKHLVLVV